MERLVYRLPMVRENLKMDSWTLSLSHGVLKEWKNFLVVRHNSGTYQTRLSLCEDRLSMILDANSD
jgi:hypothetical protein